MMDEIVTVWLTRYEWFRELPRPWKQAAHRLVKELTAERFAGLSALHLALSAKDLDAVWDALADEGVSDKGVEFIDNIVREL